MTGQTTVGRDFITAGKAVFTMVGKDSRFTYKVTRKAARPGFERYGDSYFVSVLNGPDNESNYQYLGMLDPQTGNVRPTRNSKVGITAPSFKAINWALPLIWAGRTMPAGFSIFHEGKCGRCGRRLTVPESILTGIGPECAAVMGLPMVSGVSPTPKPKRARRAKTVEAPTPVPVGFEERKSLVELAAALEKPEGWDTDQMAGFLTSELPAA